MKKPIILATFLFTSLSAYSHECTQFINEGWSADEGYACQVSSADLERLKFHKMEVCIGSVPYLDGQRYAHAEYKWVPLDQYHNPYSQEHGIHDKYFEKLYTGLAFAGLSNDDTFIRNEEEFYLKTHREGSASLNENDYKTELLLNLGGGQGQLSAFRRESTYVLKKKWNKIIDVSFQCQRIR